MSEVNAAHMRHIGACAVLISVAYIFIGFTTIHSTKKFIKTNKLITDIHEIFVGPKYYFWTDVVGFIMAVGGSVFAVISRCVSFSRGKGLIYYLTSFYIFNLGLLAASTFYETYIPSFAKTNEIHILHNLHNIQHFQNWNFVQRELKCCGATSYEDWYGHAFWPNRNHVPDSCCNTENASLFKVTGCGRLEPKEWYSYGCIDAYLNYFYGATTFRFFQNLVTYWVTFLFLATFIYYACYSYT